MIVVSDTSPLTALLTIGQADLLSRLFGDVIIPQAVEIELRRNHPKLPPWIRVERVKDSAKAKQYATIVDYGEAEAIALAEELKPDHLLIDECKGRRLAQERGLPVLGLLGVVLIAKRAGLITSARKLVEELHQKAGVYLSEDVKNAALKTVGE
jgi:predicted nucleic acid-binding protein